MCIRDRAYINGVRAIRMDLLPLGWRLSRTGNVEATVNDKLGIQICFQNVDIACTEQNPQAISGKGAGSRKLIQNGVQLRSYSNEILDAAYKAAVQLYSDESAKNPAFKKIYDAYLAFQKTQDQWFSVAELRYSSESMSPRRADSFSLRFSAPPSVPIDTSERNASAAENRVSCW